MRSLCLRSLFAAAALIAGCGEVALYPDGGGNPDGAGNIDSGDDTPDATPMPDMAPAAPPDAVKSTVVATPVSGLFADSVDASVITVTVKDADNNPLAGQMVMLGSPSPGVTFTQPPVTDEDGVARGMLRASTPGSKTVTASAGTEVGDLIQLEQQPIVMFRVPPITFDFVGEVATLNDPDGIVSGFIQIGDPVSGSFAIDSLQSDTTADAQVGTFPNRTRGFGITTTIKMRQFQTKADDVVFDTRVVHRAGTEDRYELTSSENVSSMAGILVDTITWKIEDLTGSSLPNDHQVLDPSLLCLTGACATNWSQPQGLVITGHNAAGDTFTITALLDDVGF